MAIILLVEPDKILADTYTAMFEQSGHGVVTASGAQAAIDAADSSQPDIIVLELQLPVHSGIEFMYELRSYQEWRDIPVVVHSFLPPDDKPNTAPHWKALGVMSYLYKPHTSLHKLTQTIQDILQPVP